MSRRLEDLHPILAIKAQEFILGCEKQNVPVLIYFTWRSFAEQEALYAQSRTTSGPKCCHSGKSLEIGECPKHPLGLAITNARGGQSYHNYGLAFDAAPLKADGKHIDWSSRADVDQDQVPDYEEMGEVGEALGLEWGKRLTTIPGDLGHFQMSFGLSIKTCNLLYFQGGIQAVWNAATKKFGNNLWP